MSVFARIDTFQRYICNYPLAVPSVLKITERIQHLRNELVVCDVMLFHHLILIIIIQGSSKQN